MLIPTRSGCDPPHLSGRWIFSTNFNSKHCPQLASPLRPWSPLTAIAAKPMLRRDLTGNGWLSAQDAALPPAPQTDGSFASASFAPVSALQARIGRFMPPLPGQEQLGLQQSQ